MKRFLLTFALLAAGKAAMFFFLPSPGSCAGFAGGVCTANIPSGTTGFYFIDPSAGADTNNGMTEATAFQHPPGCVNATSNSALAYTQPASGIGWIIKGGTTTTSGCYPLSVPDSGASGAPDYIGYDPGWYINSAWARPILNGGGSSGYDIATQSLVNDVQNHASYLTIDNIEITGLYFKSACSSNGPEYCGAITMYGYNGSDVAWEIKNVYIHGWGHCAISVCNSTITSISQTSGTVTAFSSTLPSNGQYVVMAGQSNSSFSGSYAVTIPSAGVCTGCFQYNPGASGTSTGGYWSPIIDPSNQTSWIQINQDQTGASSAHDNVINGADSSQDCCNAMAAWVEYRNYLGYLDNYEFGEISQFHDNAIRNAVVTFEPAPNEPHGNCIHLFGSSSSSLKMLIYNNSVYCLNTSTDDEMFLVEEDAAYVYAFNNVLVQDGHGTMFELAHNNVNGGNYTFFRNTSECGVDPTPGGNCFHWKNGTETVVGRHNFFTTSGTPIYNTGATWSATFTPANGGIVITAPIGSGNGTGNLNISETYPFAPLDSTAATTVGTSAGDETLCTTIAAINSAAGTACLSDTTLGVSLNATSNTVVYPARTPIIHSTTGNWVNGAYEYSASQAAAPVITLAAGTYNGVQQTKVTNSNSGTTVVACTINGATPATNGDGQTIATGFSLQGATAYYTIGASETLKCVAGTSTLADSPVVSSAYTINNANVITSDSFGAQCQADTPNCNGYVIPSNMPSHFRLWDAKSPYYSTSTAGTNCTWASIESVTAGSYTWTCLDNWMVAINSYRATHPNFTATYTFGMFPCTEYNGGVLPSFSVTAVTGNTGTPGLNAGSTMTLTGSFGSVTLAGTVVTLSGMQNAGNDIAIQSNGVSAVYVSSWTGSSVTLTNFAGTTTESGSTGTLQLAPFTKGCGEVPTDLPLSAGSPWNGTPPSPGPSPSFDNFVTALVNHCAASAPTVCFYNTFNGIEGWNEPNNNFFCNPGFCTSAQIVQMLEGAIPIIRAKMTGSGGTNKVKVQTIATTASAAASSAILGYETANGILSDDFVWHEYWGSSTSGAPETVIGAVNTIAAVRSSNVGWANTPIRITESSWQSTATPYGCSVNSPWTAADCEGQMVRWQLLTQSNGLIGSDWYNWDINIGTVSGYASVYAEMQTLMTGGTLTSACTNAGAIYTCPFTEASGRTALWAWNYCPNNGSYSTCAANGASYTVPSNYTNYYDLTGTNHPVASGGTVTLGVQPFLFEQAPYITFGPGTSGQSIVLEGIVF